MKEQINHSVDVTGRSEERLLFLGGHGWLPAMNIDQTRFLASSSAQSVPAIFTLQEPIKKDILSGCVITYVNSTTEHTSYWEAWHKAPQPDVASVTAYWSMDRGEELSKLIQSNRLPLECVFNSASALFGLQAALRLASDEKSSGLMSRITFAFPAGFIKKAKVAEDQKRNMQLYHQWVKHKILLSDCPFPTSEIRKREEGGISFARRLLQSGGVREEAAAAVSLHTNDLHELSVRRRSQGLSLPGIVAGNYDSLFPAKRIAESISIDDISYYLVSNHRHGWERHDGRAAFIENWRRIRELQDASSYSNVSAVDKVLFAEKVTDEKKREIFEALNI